MNAFYTRVMRIGARLIFWVAIGLLIIQVVDDAIALVTVARMLAQPAPFGMSISLINVIPKLIEQFTWPALLLALSMVIHRLDALIGREGLRQ